MGANEADPFEEFEFKPLTEGLGFHRKPEANQADKSSNRKGSEKSAEVSLGSTALERLQMKNQLESPKNVSNGTKLPEDLLDLSHLVGEVEEELDKPLLKTPLLRRNGNKENTPEVPTPSSKKVDDVLQTFKDRKWDFKEDKVSAKNLKTPLQTVYKTSGYDLSAVILDAMLITASFLGCLIVLLMVTQADLVAAVTTTSSLHLSLGLAGVLAVVCWAYLILNRLYLGATPGEWVFDQRVGKPGDQGRAIFSLKVLVRATLILLTGVVLIPTLSLIMGRDLLGRWLGIELHQKHYV